MTIARTTLSDQVAAGIVADIAARGMRTGDEIAAEGELAEEYGVNRLVVREAIRILAARGILASSQGRRARVSTPSPTILEQILSFRIGQESMDFADLVSTRTLLECEITRRAASAVAAGTAEVTALAASLDAMLTHQDDREEFIRHDIAFHERIADLAEAEILSFILAALRGVLLEARRASYDARARRESGVATTIGQHRAILQAVAAGDEQAAVAAMSEHLASTRMDLGL